MLLGRAFVCQVESVQVLSLDGLAALRSCRRGLSCFKAGGPQPRTPSPEVHARLLDVFYDRRSPLSQQPLHPKLFDP